jgi:hypothetical protein
MKSSKTVVTDGQPFFKDVAASLFNRDRLVHGAYFF